MVKAFGDHAKSQSLHLGLGLVPRGPVRENAGQVGYFSDPTTVVFSLDFNLEGHTASCRHRHSTGPLGLGKVHRTPGISCEAVPACCRGGAGMRRHLRLSAACGARVGAAESFVSFIPLFDGALMAPPSADPFATATYSSSAIRASTSWRTSVAGRPDLASNRTVPALVSYLARLAARVAMVEPLIGW